MNRQRALTIHLCAAMVTHDNGLIDVAFHFNSQWQRYPPVSAVAYSSAQVAAHPPNLCDPPAVVKCWYAVCSAYIYAAEPAFRHAVLWRKGSGGTDCSPGSRFVERVLSIRETCRQQGRGLLEYLVECCQAHVEGKEAPCLLPEGGHRLEVA